MLSFHCCAVFAFVAVATTFAAFQYRNCNLLHTGTKNKIKIQQKYLRPTTASSVKLSGAVIAVADSEFAKKYRNQLSTQKCVAKRSGLDFILLDANNYTACKKYNDFFFRKHCAVSCFLKHQQKGFIAFVMDADVVGVPSNASLVPWFNLAKENDLVFYERSWNFEIMAGNYIVKNSEYARGFLLRWSNFEYFKPSGFSSSDNGAIHLHVLHELGISGPKKCAELYKNLIANVPNLNPYFEFVACTRELLGPARRWKIDKTEEHHIVILNRYHAWSVDGFTLHFRYGNRIPFHHGVKNAEDIKTKYGYDDRQDAIRCLQRSDNLISEDTILLNSEDYWFKQISSPVPRWDLRDCLRNFSCFPLNNDDIVLSEPVYGTKKEIKTKKIQYLNSIPLRNY